MKILRLLPFILLAAVACQKEKKIQSDYTAYTGATVFDGTTSIRDAVLIVKGGRVVALGKKDETPIPDGTEIRDTKGLFIIPGLINGHGHVGEVKGIEGNHYSFKNIIDNLAIYARYGVTTVVSLGGDKKESVPLRAVNDTISTQHGRLYIAGAVITGDTPEEALAVVDSNAHMGVDFMKIRVDDNLGTATKMTEKVYRAVIKRSHELGYKIATHMYYLDDAKKLLDAGSDLMAHSVRDKPVDDEFIRVMKEKKIAYCPTLTRELSTFVYGDTPEFFSDPFFQREYDSATIQPLKDSARQQKIKDSKSAKTYRQQLPTAMANLKKLSDEGITIIFGTDTGVPTRFLGYFEHIEMSMMAEAGLTPLQILQSATVNAANYLGLKDVGSLAPGSHADFIILEGDPIADIKNARKIKSVIIGGEEVRK